MFFLGRAHPRFLGLAAMALVLPTKISAHPAHAQPVNYPFVVGFERFYSGDDDPEYLAEGGLVLLNELNCVACHAPPPALKDQLAGHPGSNLAGVGSRLSPLDLELMIRNPRFLKPDNLMPSLFAGPDRDLEEVEALKHFLASMKSPVAGAADDSPAPEPMPKGVAVAGQNLYHRIGCVACHAPEVGYRPKDLPDGIDIELTGLPSVPLNLSDKYEETALVQFLLDPVAHRPSGRMPDFKLGPREAADLAAYLKSGLKSPLPEALKAAFEAADEFEVDPARVAIGREVFLAKNCFACHPDTPGVITNAGPGIKPLADLRPDPANRKGCLSKRPRGGLVPAYLLDEVQVLAIEAALSRLPERKPLDRDGRIDWLMMTLNCYACHERGGKGAPETAREAYFAVNDVGALASGRWGNIPPPLDRVGRKLTGEWFERILFGHGGDGEVRQYMEARMPIYPETLTRPLLDDLKAADVREQPVEIDVSGLLKHQRGLHGRNLMGINGLGCVNCHGLKGRKPLGAPVIDLSHTVQRLQPAYFKELLLDPQATQPGTLMPPLFAGRKKADQEIEQIWTYLKEIDQQRVPDGLLRTDDFELKPSEEGRPIVFRTFLEGAGVQAVAVGFPEGINAAFDSRECRWRIAWRGRFLDALSTWDDRFCAPAKPLGEPVTDLGEACPRPDAGKDEVEFRGFELDEKGVPTFLYRIGEQTVRDRIEPGGNGLKRTVVSGGNESVETRISLPSP